MDFNLEELTRTAAKYDNCCIGNDIVYLPHFKDSFSEPFKNKVYTRLEIDYCEQFSEPLLRYASTWAAKEAVYKAIKQLDDSAKGYKAIEISRDKPAGKPTVTLTKSERKFKISLSMSHDGDYVWAVALATEIREADDKTSF